MEWSRDKELYGGYITHKHKKQLEADTNLASSNRFFQDLAKKSDVNQPKVAIVSQFWIKTLHINPINWLANRIPQFMFYQVEFNADDTSNVTSEITIPGSIIKIEKYAFTDSDITKVNFSNDVHTNLTDIGYGAFFNTQISEIEIPSTVERIGEYAFANCVNLTTVIFRGDPDSIECYNKDGSTGNFDSIFIGGSENLKISYVPVGEEIPDYGKNTESPTKKASKQQAPKSTSQEEPAEAQSEPENLRMELEEVKDSDEEKVDDEITAESELELPEEDEEEGEE